MTESPVEPLICKMAVPTIISMLITSIYNMADTFFVGRLGTSATGAVGVVFPLMALIQAVGFFFGQGSGNYISRQLGAQHREEAERMAATGFFSALCAGCVIMILGLLLRHPLAHLLGATDTILPYALDYMCIILIGAPYMTASLVLNNQLRLQGNAVYAMIGLVSGGVLNMALDPLFIFVFRLEITGAAIATMLSNVAALCYFLLFLRKIRRESTITLSPRQYSLGDGIPGEVLAVGLPSFMISTMATFSNIMLNKIISADSNEAIAGMGIAKKIDLLAFAIAQGLTQGTLPLIGFNYTSGDRRRMMGVIRALLFSCLAISLSGALLLFWEAKPITRLFIGNAKTVAFGRTYLRILSIACPTTALNFFCITVFQATGRKLRPALLTMMRKGGLDVPLMFVFDRLLGTAGVAWATPVADAAALAVAAAMLVPYLRRLKSGQA